MNRFPIAALLTVVAAVATSADAQTWMFQPGTYSDPQSLQAAQSTTAPTAGVSGAPQGPQAVGASAGPHAYATFTETQAVAAAKLSKPDFHWDPTGVRGRMMRYQSWSHEEAIEANRLRTYGQGVRDAVGAPIWTWNGAAPQPLPRIVAPTETASGMTKSATTP